MSFHPGILSSGVLRHSRLLLSRLYQNKERIGILMSGAWAKTTLNSPNKLLAMPQRPRR